VNLGGIVSPRKSSPSRRVISRRDHILPAREVFEGQRLSLEYFNMHAAEFLLVKQTAAILRKSESTIRRLVREGTIRSLKVGGTVWIWMPSLDALISDEFTE
jgi:excisionase family DNA binding protein